MRYKKWYNRRLMDEMGFEPESMRRDARYGGTDFEEADQELFRELMEDRNSL